MKSLILFSSLLLLVTQAFAGQDKGNGGFLYSHTSKKLLDEAQRLTLAELDDVIKNGTTTVSSEYCQQEISLSKLKKNVQELEVNYTESTIGTNPDGQDENRYFQISDGKVVATKEYFSSFVDTYFRYSDEADFYKKTIMLSPVQKGIIHESLHLYNYDESEKCTQDIMNILMNTNSEIIRHQKYISEEKLNKRIVKALTYGYNYAKNTFNYNRLSLRKYQTSFNAIALSFSINYLDNETPGNPSTWESDLNQEVGKITNEQILKSLTSLAQINFCQRGNSSDCSVLEAQVSNPNLAKLMSEVLLYNQGDTENVAKVINNYVHFKFEDSYSPYQAE